MSRPDDPSDEDLLRRYARGDGAAARLLLDRRAPPVFRLARRLLRDEAEAEDVTQEAMVRLWQIAPQWQPGTAQVSTWLYRVAFNLATDRLRRRRGLALDSVEEPLSTAPAVVDGMIAADRVRALDDALASLPERQRAAVVLRHIEGLANPEIATVMGIGVEAVESLTARGKRRLAAILSGQREELGFER
ncbi:MAG: RNA polymerase sigma-70 factor, ECF subfamily [Rhodobacteraceae bacterium HLUCCA12]|nr:MAG: RNA polymerase sigma-70 factor, ECF subfamily [Rhodobacteraceae bacterium HLUCCA12]